MLSPLRIISIQITEGQHTIKGADEWCPGKRWDEIQKAFFEPVEALFDMPKLLNRPAR